MLRFVMMVSKCCLPNQDISAYYAHPTVLMYHRNELMPHQLDSCARTWAHSDQGEILSLQLFPHVSIGISNVSHY